MQWVCVGLLILRGRLDLREDDACKEEMNRCLSTHLKRIRVPKCPVFDTEHVGIRNADGSVRSSSQRFVYERILAYVVGSQGFYGIGIKNPTGLGNAIPSPIRAATSLEIMAIGRSRLYRNAHRHHGCVCPR